MPFRVEAHGLLAREDEAHRPPRDASQERGLRLDRHVLLAAEGAAVRDEDDVDLLLGQAHERGDLPPVVEDALSLGVEGQSGLRVLPRDVAGRGETRLGLDVQVLDALRLPRALDDVRRRRERGLDVAAPDDRAREKVALPSHARSARTERLLGVRHGREDLVVDVHERRRRAGGARVDRGDGGENVADVAGFLALGHEARPVVDDHADEALAGYVARGDDGHHAGMACRPRRVDPLHAGPCVRRERHGAVEHPGENEVGDVGPRPERQLLGFVPVEAGPDAARAVRRRERLAAAQAGGGMERVHDLDVPGATAKVWVELPLDLLVRRIGVRVQDALHPERDARDAEAALESRCTRERLAVDAALPFGYALQRQDALPRGIPGGDRARHLRMSVHENEARPALPLRRAAILRRRDPGAVAEELQERRLVRDVEGAGCAVECQLNVHEEPPFDLSG